MSIKWGVLGTAGIAAGCTIPGMKQAEGCELYAIAGRNENKVLKFQEKYGFKANAIVSMTDVIEHLYNKPYKGQVLIDDTLKAAIDAYYAEYGA